MRDKVVFFILGALLATIAYFAGDMNKAGARDHFQEFEDVLVKGDLIVSGGRLVIHNDSPFSEDIDNYIEFQVNKEASAILMITGKGQDPGDMTASSVSIKTTMMADLKPVAGIQLTGDYGEEGVILWSFDNEVE
jgi:hypothetical protein